jgi:hypothetical protein
VYWSAVVPLGMCTVCTHRLVEMTNQPILAPIPKYFVAIALGAWGIIFLGLVWRCARQLMGTRNGRELNTA